MSVVAVELLEVLGIGASLVAAFVVSGAFRARRGLARLRQLRPTALGYVQPGLVKVVGRVRRVGELVVAPICSEPCVGFVAQAIDETWEGSVHRPVEAACADFEIVDDTGVAFVAGSHVVLELGVDHAYHAVVLPPPRLAAFATRHRLDASWSHGRRICTEGLLREGDLVVVAGAGRLERDEDPKQVTDYRELPHRFVIRGDEGTPLLISDDPQNP